MKSIVENLFAIQTLQLQAGSNQQKHQQEIEALRKTIPGSILKQYDRFVARGKKGVAVVRNGVCTECHIGLATGPLAGLTNIGDVRTCGNCGRYLFLPASPAVVPIITPTVAKAPRRKREVLAHAS